MACEGKAWLGGTNVFSIVITDWEFSVGALFVSIINNANITATEDWSFIRIICDGKLSEVQVEFLTHI